MEEHIYWGFDSLRRHKNKKYGNGCRLYCCKKAIEDLEKLLSDKEHGERE